MTTRTPVIIDTDPGVDDTLALLLALASPELEILAIIVTFGNTDVDASYLNVFRIYRALSRHLEQCPEDKSRFPNFKPEDANSRPILVRGSSHPLEGELHSAQYFHGRDGQGGITLRHPECDAGANLKEEGRLFFRETDNNPADVVLGLLREYPAKSVSYVGLGPLTSLANILRHDSSTFCDQIGQVVCMGGALDVPGNTTAVAEFNWFADPYAVRELFIPSDSNAGLSLDRALVLPLDITTPHEMPFPVYKELVDRAFDSTKQPSVASQKPPLHHFTSSILERTREIMCEFGKDAMELHDPVAIWCAIANPPPRLASTLAEGWHAVRRRFDIERTGELTRGMVVVDRRDDTGAYAPGENRAQAETASVGGHIASPIQQETAAMPAPVEVEDEQAAKKWVSHTPTTADEGATAAGDGPGVWCVTETPGPRAMLEVLLDRIWGVQL